MLDSLTLDERNTLRNIGYGVVKLKDVPHWESLYRRGYVSRILSGGLSFTNLTPFGRKTLDVPNS